ncbi:hypothetical protein QUA56_06830 [Microcoleus sp. N3A4]|uniref:hypothetical protein n=1 Tax=Microcoleus sp. N3A4 TaxID=3055379 RepID=UPI002FD5C36D
MSLSIVLYCALKFDRGMVRRYGLNAFLARTFGATHPTLTLKFDRGRVRRYGLNAFLARIFGATHPTLTKEFGRDRVILDT